MISQVWWYLARAAGVVAWVAATFSVLAGLSLTLRLTDRPRPAWVLDVHRFLAGASVVFTTIHIAALVADSYIDFGIVEVLVPYASAWKSGPVALGVIAFWLLAAIEVTSLMMKRLPRRVWRAIHGSAFALFVLTTGHALGAGTDASNVVFKGFAWASCIAFVFLSIARALLVGEKRRRAAPAATAALEPAPDELASSAPTG